MKKIVFKLFLISILAVFTIACESENTQDAEVKEDSTEVSDQNNDQNDEISNPNRVTMVPTPNELFDIIKELNISYDEQILNSPDNIELYTDKRAQSLILVYILLIWHLLLVLETLLPLLNISLSLRIWVIC